MANTAALLGTLLNTNADINYYVQQQIYWSNKYEANAAKLAEQVKFENQWEKASDSAMNNNKELSASHGGITIVVGKENSDVELADAYAHVKVYQYDEELKLELSDLDIEYDTMKTMYETLLEKLRADQEGEQQATSNAAQDTGLLQS